MAIANDQELMDRNALISEEMGFLTREDVDQQDPLDASNMVAGWGAGAGKVGRRMVRKLRKLSRSRKVEESIEEFANPSKLHVKRGPVRRINIERHHPAAAAGYVNDVAEALKAEDLINLMDTTAKDFKMGPIERQTHASIDEATDSMEKIFDHLTPVFKGEQNGLLDATQMNGARKWLTTLGEELVPLAKEIAGGNATPAKLAEFEKKQAGFASVMALVQNNATEVARALAQQRMIAQAVDSNMSNVLMETLGNKGGPEAIVKMAKLLTKKYEEDGTEGLVNSVKVSWADRGMALIELWKANILSSPATHAVNIMGNTLVQFHENMFIKPAAAMSGSARFLTSKITGNPPPIDRVTWREAYASGRAGWRGFTLGLQASIDAMLERESKLGLPMKGTKADVEGKLEKVLVSHYGTAGKWANEAITLPFRLLQAEDDFFKAIAYTTEIEGLATRQAIAEGLKSSADIEARVATLLKEPPLQMQAEAYQHALNVTFQNKDLSGTMGIMSEYIKKAKSGVPMLEFVMPFVTTPSNVLHYTIENTALAPFTKQIRNDWLAGGARRDLANARIFMGIGITTMAMVAHDQELFTGSGPENPQVRRQLMKTGWLPNAIKVGDTYVQINRLDPLGAAIGMVADALDRAKYAAEESSAGAMIAESIVTLARHGLDASYMRGVKGFFDAIQFGGKSLAQYVANAGNAFIPYSSGRKWVANVLRGGQIVQLPKNFHKKDIFQQTHILLEAYKERDKFSDSTIRPARHWDGSVVLPEQGIMGTWNSAFPVQLSKAKKIPDAATRELIKNNVGVKHPSPVISFGRGPSAISFSIQELDGYRGILYDAYIRHVGEARKEAVEKLVNKQSYHDMIAGQNDEQGIALKAAINKGMLAGKIAFLKDLKNLIAANDELATDFGRAVGEVFAEPSTVLSGELERLALQFEQAEIRGKGETLPLPPHVRKQEQQRPAITF